MIDAEAQREVDPEEALARSSDFRAAMGRSPQRSVSRNRLSSSLRILSTSPEGRCRPTGFGEHLATLAQPTAEPPAMRGSQRGGWLPVMAQPLRSPRPSSWRAKGRGRSAVRAGSSRGGCAAQPRRATAAVEVVLSSGGAKSCSVNAGSKPACAPLGDMSADVVGPGSGGKRSRHRHDRGSHGDDLALGAGARGVCSQNLRRWRLACPRGRNRATKILLRSPTRC